MCLFLKMLRKNHLRKLFEKFVVKNKIESSEGFLICRTNSINTDRIYLNWKINVLNPSYLHLQGLSACATERSDAWETPTYRTNVLIPFHSHCIPRPPFRSVLMCRCDRNLLRWQRVVLSERPHKMSRSLKRYISLLLSSSRHIF